MANDVDDPYNGGNRVQVKDILIHATYFGGVDEFVGQTFSDGLHGSECRITSTYERESVMVPSGGNGS
jgi:hypothetical protein